MELLQYLYLECKCEQLSDLNTKVLVKHFPPRLLSVLRQADASQWSCSEWKDAILYMTNKNITAYSAETYQKTLLWILENQSSPVSHRVESSQSTSSYHLRHKLQRQFYSILKESCAENAAHFFLGNGGSEELLSLKNRLEKEFPEIHIAGMYALPHGTILDMENVRICQLITEAKPDVLWVCLSKGTPKKWMLEQAKRLPKCVMIGIDGGLEFLLELI